MSKKPKVKRSEVELLRFAYWIICNRMIFTGVKVSSVKRSVIWDCAEELVAHWRKEVK